MFDTTQVSSLSKLSSLLLVKTCLLLLLMLILGTTPVFGEDDWQEQWYGKLYRIKCEGHDLNVYPENGWGDSGRIGGYLDCNSKRSRENLIEKSRWMVFPMTKDVVFIANYETGLLLGSKAPYRFSSTQDWPKKALDPILKEYRAADPASSSTSIPLQKCFQMFLLKKTGMTGKHSKYTIQNVTGHFLKVPTPVEGRNLFDTGFLHEEDPSTSKWPGSTEFVFEEVGIHPNIIPFKKFTKQAELATPDIPSIEKVTVDGPSKGKKVFSKIKMLPYFLVSEPGDLRQIESGAPRTFVPYGRFVDRKGKKRKFGGQKGQNENEASRKYRLTRACREYAKYLETQYTQRIKSSPYYRLDRHTAYIPACEPAAVGGAPIVVHGPSTRTVAYSVGSSTATSVNWGHTVGAAVTATVTAKVGFLGSGGSVSGSIGTSYEFNINKTLTETTSKSWTLEHSYPAEKGQTVYVYQKMHEYTLHNSRDKMVKDSLMVVKEPGDFPMVFPPPKPLAKPEATLEGTWQEDGNSKTFKLDIRKTGNKISFRALVEPARRARTGYTNEDRYTGTFDPGTLELTAKVKRNVYKGSKRIESFVIHKEVKGFITGDLRDLSSVSWTHGPHWKKKNK